MRVVRFATERESLPQIYVWKSSLFSLSLSKVWWSIITANLATTFQDLVAKVKSLVVPAPVLGAMSRPDNALSWLIHERYIDEETVWCIPGDKFLFFWLSDSNGKELLLCYNGKISLSLLLNTNECLLCPYYSTQTSSYIPLDTRSHY